MFDGGGMIMSFHALNCPPSLLSNVNKTLYRTRPTSPPLSLLLAQTVESGNYPQSSKNSGTCATIRKRRSPKHLLNQPNTVGIIGGASVSSTLIFLEKLVWWSARDGEDCLPFVVCSDPSLNEELMLSTLLHSLKTRSSQINLNDDHSSMVVENLQRKRAFLEKSGARCIVMPCHISHTWHAEISEGCSLPFLHIGECVARELKEANLKPLEAGNGVRIGLLGSDGILSAGFYQEKLQSQGFEVVLPDKATIEHMLIPAVESVNKRDMEGAQNLLRIAIQVLLVRAVNVVILASNDLRGVLPHDDPLLNKCIDPMDALARSTIKWARSIKKVRKRSAK